jgi:hypothetical protein
MTLVESRERDRSVEPFGLLPEETDLLDTPAVLREERLPAGWIESDRDVGMRLVLLIRREEPRGEVVDHPRLAAGPST